MGILKTSVDMHLEVAAHIERLRTLCDQLDSALQAAQTDRSHINDLTARARAVITLIERKVNSGD